MKKRLILTALLLSSCSQLPAERKVAAPEIVMVPEQPVVVQQDEIVIENDETAESVAAVIREPGAGRLRGSSGPSDTGLLRPTAGRSSARFVTVSPAVR